MTKEVSYFNPVKKCLAVMGLILRCDWELSFLWSVLRISDLSPCASSTRDARAFPPRQAVSWGSRRQLPKSENPGPNGQKGLSAGTRCSGEPATGASSNWHLQQRLGERPPLKGCSSCSKGHALNYHVTVQLISN